MANTINLNYSFFQEGYFVEIHLSEGKKLSGFMGGLRSPDIEEAKKNLSTKLTETMQGLGSKDVSEISVNSITKNKFRLRLHNQYFDVLYDHLVSEFPDITFTNNRGK